MEETHGIAMRTKVAVSFANIFMSAVETEIINKSKIKPLEWKRYIDEVFFLWDTTREETDQFILVANRHHPTIHFTAEISEEKINFLDTTFFKGERFYKDSIFDIRTLFKQTETSVLNSWVAFLLLSRSGREKRVHQKPSP